MSRVGKAQLARIGPCQRTEVRMIGHSSDGALETSGRPGGSLQVAVTTDAVPVPHHQQTLVAPMLLMTGRTGRHGIKKLSTGMNQPGMTGNTGSIHLLLNSTTISQGVQGPPRLDVALGTTQAGMAGRQGARHQHGGVALPQQAISQHANGTQESSDGQQQDCTALHREAPPLR